MTNGNGTATVVVWLKLDGDGLARELQDACDRLYMTDGDVVLDFSAVQRIDPASIDAMEELADKAGDLGVRLVLRGVNVEVYKVLKLVKLTPHFLFVN